MCLSKSNVQLGGVLLQPYIVAMKMHCQPRLVCSVNLRGGWGGPLQYLEGETAKLKRKRTHTQKEMDSRGAASTETDDRLLLGHMGPLMFHYI